MDEEIILLFKGLQSQVPEENSYSNQIIMQLIDDPEKIDQWINLINPQNYTLYVQHALFCLNNSIKKHWNMFNEEVKKGILIFIIESTVLFDDTLIINTFIQIINFFFTNSPEFNDIIINFFNYHLSNDPEPSNIIIKMIPELGEIIDDQIPGSSQIIFNHCRKYIDYAAATSDHQIDNENIVNSIGYVFNLPLSDQLSAYIGLFLTYYFKLFSHLSITFESAYFLKYWEIIENFVYNSAVDKNAIEFMYKTCLEILKCQQISKGQICTILFTLSVIGVESYKLCKEPKNILIAYDLIYKYGKKLFEYDSAIVFDNVIITLSGYLLQTCYSQMNANEYHIIYEKMVALTNKELKNDKISSVSLASAISCICGIIISVDICPNDKITDFVFNVISACIKKNEEILYILSLFLIQLIYSHNYYSQNKNFYVIEIIKPAFFSHDETIQSLAFKIVELFYDNNISLNCLNSFLVQNIENIPHDIFLKSLVYSLLTMNEIPEDQLSYLVLYYTENILDISKFDINFKILLLIYDNPQFTIDTSYLPKYIDYFLDNFDDNIDNISSLIEVMNKIPLPLVDYICYMYQKMEFIISNNNDDNTKRTMNLYGFYILLTRLMIKYEKLSDFSVIGSITKEFVSYLNPNRGNNNLIISTLSYIARYLDIELINYLFESIDQLLLEMPAESEETIKLSFSLMEKIVNHQHDIIGSSPQTMSLIIRIITHITNGNYLFFYFIDDDVKISDSNHINVYNFLESLVPILNYQQVQDLIGLNLLLIEKTNFREIFITTYLSFLKCAVDNSSVTNIDNLDLYERCFGCIESITPFIRSKSINNFVILLYKMAKKKIHIEHFVIPLTCSIVEEYDKLKETPLTDQPQFLLNNITSLFLRLAADYDIQCINDRINIILQQFYTSEHTLYEIEYKNLLIFAKRRTNLDEEQKQYIEQAIDKLINSRFLMRSIKNQEVLQELINYSSQSNNAEQEDIIVR